MATTTTECCKRVAEVALDELAYLAPTLADERDHVDGGGGGAGDHAEQRGLADAGAGEDPQPLPAPAGNEAVQSAHPERDALADPRPAQRGGGRGDRGAQVRAGLPAGVAGGGLAACAAESVAERGAEPVEGGAEPVQWGAEPIDHAPQQVRADGHTEGRAGGEHLGAGADALQLAEGHQQGAAFAKADDLGRHRLAVTVGPDEAHLADLGLQPGGLDDQPDQVVHAPVAASQIGAGQCAGGALEELTAHRGPPRRRAPLE